MTVSVTVFFWSLNLLIYPHFFLKVNEWAKRKKEEQYYVIGVKQHKTAAHQVAIFALSEEEESVRSSQ